MRRRNVLATGCDAKGRSPVSPVAGAGSRSQLCRRRVTALGEVGVALAFGRIVVVVLDTQTANATVHLTDNVMLPAGD